MNTRTCGHPLSPENTRKGNRGCKRCALDRKIADLARTKLPKAKAREAHQQPQPETPKPWQSDYEYGLAIAQRRRKERQDAVHEGVQRALAQFGEVSRGNKIVKHELFSLYT